MVQGVKDCGLAVAEAGRAISIRMQMARWRIRIATSGEHAVSGRRQYAERAVEIQIFLQSARSKSELSTSVPPRSKLTWE
jgi:hypothetical protein